MFLIDSHIFVHVQITRSASLVHCTRLIYACNVMCIYSHHGQQTVFLLSLYKITAFIMYSFLIVKIDWLTPNGVLVVRTYRVAAGVVTGGCSINRRIWRLGLSKGHSSVVRAHTAQARVLGFSSQRVPAFGYSLPCLRPSPLIYFCWWKINPTL